METTSMEDLKRAILRIEKRAVMVEDMADEHTSAGHLMAACRAGDEAKDMRIAAACMWEKLERLEKEVGAGC